MYVTLSNVATLLGVMWATSTPTATGGFSTATGSKAPAVTVATLVELQKAIDAGHTHIVIHGRIYGGPKPVFLNFATTRWNDTTIEGEPGGNATLLNIQLKFDGEKLAPGVKIENIVVRNLSFQGIVSDLQALPRQQFATPESLGINYEGVSFRRCANVWVDHCTLLNTSDDLMSISLSSDNVTVSGCHFLFSADWLHMIPNPIWNWVGPNQDLASERLAMLIGQNKADSYVYGGKALHVTLHHNWFGPNIKGRPLCRGFVHVYNNYFDNSSAPTGINAAGYSTTPYNALQIGSGGDVYSEGNYFNKTNQSNRVGLDSPGDSYQFHERGNIYHQITGSSITGTGFAGAPGILFLHR